jgi:hypothetical protein
MVAWGRRAQITPIHLVDNGFGGAAIFDDHMNVNQLDLRDTLLEPDPAGCKDERVDFEFTGGSASLAAAMVTAGVLLPHYPRRTNGRGALLPRGLSSSAKPCSI